MKKLIISLMIVSILFLTVACCSSTVQTHDSIEKDNNSMFILVEQAPFWEIVYHRDTKVMYSVSDAQYNRGNFTLLVNPDGSPMLYED